MMTDPADEPDAKTEPVEGLDKNEVTPEEAKAEEEAAKLGDFA